MPLAARLLALVALAAAPALGVVAYKEYDERLSRAAEARDFVADTSRRAAAEVRQIVENAQRFSAIVAKLPDVRAAAAGSGYAEGCSTLLTSLRQDVPGQLAFGIANREGLIVCTTEGARSARPVAGEHFKQAVETNRFVVGTYGESRTTAMRYLTLAHPIRDEGGAAVGAVLTGIDLGWLAERMRAFVGPHHAVLSVHDRNITFLARVPSDGGFIGRKPPPEVMAAARFADKGPIEATGADGARRIGAIVTVSLSPGSPDLHVAYGLSRDAVFADANAATLRGIALFLMSAALSAAAAWYGGRRFIRQPVEQLLAAARRWQAGDYGARVALPNTSSEFARLARAYETMADSLARREEERARAEQELRTSEERLRLAQDAGQIGLWDWDLKTGHVALSHGYYRLWGLNRDAVQPSFEGFLRAIHPDDRARVEAEIAEAVRHDSDWESEFRANSPDGSIRWLAVRGNVLRDEGGQPRRMLGVSFDVTRRKLIESALSSRTAQLETLLDTAPVAVWFTDDPEVRSVQRNRYAAELMRVPSSLTDSFATSGGGGLNAVRVLRDGRAVPPDELPLQRALRGEVVRNEEYTFAFGDGEERMLLSSATALTDEDGRIVGAVSVALDITARKGAEVALRAEQARAEQLAAERTAVLAQLAEGVIVTDPEGRIVLVNEAAKRIHGVEALNIPPAEYSARYGLFTADGEPHPPETLPLARAVLNRETVTDAHWRIRRSDGSEVVAAGSARPVFAADGSFVGAVLTMRDETARDLAQKALEESEERFRTVADSAPALIWMTDAKGRITFTNRYYAEVVGVSAAGLRHGGWRKVVHPEDADAFRDGFRRAFEARGPFQAEVRVKDRTGSIRWLRCEGVPRFDAAGTFLGYTGCNVDVTEARRALRHQRLLINELNHRVKNTLATVQSIAAQSFRGSDRDADSREQFEARLISLSNVHNLLTRENWEGASLDAVVREAVSPHASAAHDPFAITGTPVRLPPQMALTVAMAVHELCTNAVKYGALSVPTGQVAITWRVEHRGSERVLHLSWEESGGPPVRPPTRRGFGTRLIERQLANEFGGGVRLAFEPTGVVCRIEARLPAEDGGASASEAHESVLFGAAE